MLLLPPGGKIVSKLLLRALMVGPPRFGDACSVLDGDRCQRWESGLRKQGVEKPFGSVSTQKSVTYC
jgi:hypothetical protein